MHMHAPTHASEASPAGGCTRARDDRGVAPTMRVYVTARGYGSVFTVTDGWISTDGRTDGRGRFRSKNVFGKMTL
jgi:hypothetical protein